MAQHKPKSVGFALLLLIFVFQVHALQKCKTGCDGPSNGLLKLTPGTTYKYDYDGKINIVLSSAEAQQTTTEVKANVLLTQQADCSQVLRLQNVQIIGPDGKKRAGIPDIEKPVVLNNNNGALHEFICAEPGDSQNSLNVKRAIASLFQVNPEKNSEIDVFGLCPTFTSKHQDGDILTITKNKNLNKCAYRESITTNYITSTFDIHSGIKSSPVLNSNLDSKQKIKAGVLDSASVLENYLFVPFSVGQNGAKATIESKLTLTGTGKDSLTTKTQVGKSIIFENPHPVNLPKSNVNIVLKKVKEISEKLGTNVEDVTAVQFLDLVKLLRVSKKADILSVYNQVRSGVGFPDKNAAKKILLDAILISGNGDTIEVAIELLKNKELGPLEEKALFLGLSKARHVTENSIKTATDLLNRANLPREAFLGVGALAGKYCATHSCEKVDAVNKIIQKLLSKLGDLKAANRKEESDMIYVLKGLANINFLNDAILSKLVTLAEDKKQPVRLRVATLEAFQAAPCKDKLRDSAVKILKDNQQDSEVRIKAYLMLTQCPNEKIGNIIKAILENEKSNQVGGFITSHIKNLRSSTNPDKTLAKSVLGHIPTSNKFHFDPRKYSFNSELSYSLDTLGLGNNIEQNVIYSQNSWLPRSADLNLTAEVFGHRLNFLEIAARQENLDKVIEHYLGPQGVLRKATLQQSWDGTVKPVENFFKTLKEKVDKSLRSRRDVSKAQIDAINKKIQVKTNELDRNLDLDLSIKNFGSEVTFMNSFEIGEKISPQGLIDTIVNKLNEGLDKLKNFEKVFRSNLLFLDTELSYPTSLGFPLRLGLDGSSNIQVKTSGSIDLRQIITGAHKDLNLKLTLIPSASITVTGRFSLDTPLLENGLRVSSTLHTSSGGEVYVNTFKEGYGMDVKFKFPVQKQELIGFKHDIIFQSRENGVALNSQRLKFSQNKDFSICIDQLQNFIGLEFCADINGPNLSGKKVPILPFPLSGDAKASIRIERGEIDTFHFRREFFTEAGKMGVKATLETLDKNNKKGVGLDIEGFVSPDKYLKATLTSPIKNAEAEARLVLNDKEKVVAVSVKDETKQYTAKAGLKVDAGNDKTVYHPILEYTTPESKSPQVPPFRVEGKVIAVKSGNDMKYTFDNVQFIIPGQKTITLNGNMGTDGPAFYSDLTAGDGNLSGSVKGRIQAQPNLLKLQAEMKNTLNPSLNFNVKGEFKKNKGFESISSNLQVIHGADLNSKTNVITLANSWNVKTGKELEISTKNKFTYPLAKIDAKFDLEKVPHSLDYDAYVQYSDVKVGSELKLKYNMKTHGEYQLEFHVTGLKNNVELKSSRKVLGAFESKLDNSLSVNGKKLEITGKVTHQFKPNDINAGADFVIKTPNSKSPWKLNEGLKLNPKEIDFHLKLLSGNNALVDSLLKANKALDINGHVKVNFKEILNVNGQIKAQKGTGNGDLTIEAKSLKRTAKAETTFKINRPIYNIDLTLYPVFNVDKNKKIALSVKNKFTGNTIDMTNTLDFLGSKFVQNIKGQLGHLRSGKTSLEGDFTLPCQRFFAGKFTRQISIKDGFIDADLDIFLEDRENKGAPGRKINVVASCKGTDYRRNVYDFTTGVTLTRTNGDSINFETAMKQVKKDDKWKLDMSSKTAISTLKDPWVTSFSAEYKRLVGDIEFKTSTCPKNVHHLVAKYDFQGQDKPITGNFKLDSVLPFETLSNVKAANTFVVKPLKGNDPTASVEVSGELQTVSSNSNLNIDTKFNLNANGNKQTGNVKYHGELNKPIKSALDTSGTYNIDIEKRIGNLKGDFNAILPQNKVVKGSGSLVKIAPKEYKLEGSLDLPTSTFKSNKLNVHTKRNDNHDVKSEVEFITDGKKYALNSDLSMNSKAPSVDFKLTHPDGKLSELAANLKKPSDARLIANLKVMSQPRDFIMEGGVDVNSESLNDFYVQLTANCPKLNVNDVFIKIGNAGSSDGKTLNINISSAKKNVVSGSATVSSREEQGKFIVEGSGNFKVGDQPKSGNFKYIRTMLTSDKNGEHGEEISFDATLGNKAIDAELKLTNKEFRYLNSYCEESKQCAHIEIDAKSNVGDISRFDSELEVTIDLRVLGVPNEFGLKAVTHRQDWLLDHTVDVHFENSANKYQYSLYVHPKEIGLSLTTPKRIIALEGTIAIPTTDLKNGGKARGEVVFYTDKKNNPSSKSSLNGLLDVDIQKRTVNAEITLKTVGQTKPLSIKYTRTVPRFELITTSSEQLILDIFAKPDQKITISRTYSNEFDKETLKIHGEASIIAKSTGLGIDIDIKNILAVDPRAFTGNFERSANIQIGPSKYSSIFKIAGSPKQASILLKYLNEVIFQLNSDINLQKGLINVNNHVSGLGLKEVEAILEIKNYNSLKYSQYFKDDPNTKLLVSAALIPGQIADVRADYQAGGAKKELFHASLNLDDKNFLHPDGGVQTNNIKEYSQKVKEIVSNQVKVTTDKVKDANILISKDLRTIADKAKESVPDVSKTQQFYESEMSKFHEELATDKTLQNIGELVRNVVGAVASAITRAVNSIGEIVEKITISFNNAFGGIWKKISTEILPKLQECAKNALESLKVVLDKVTDIVFTYVAKIAEVLEAIQPHLKAIAQTFSEISEEVGRFLQKSYESIRAAVIEQIKHLKDELKASPFVSELKKRYEEFKKNGLPSQEVLVNTMKAVTGALKEVVLVPEFQNVIDLVEKYLEKKLTNKPVDDVAEIENIGRTFADGVAKFASALSKEAVPDFLKNFRIPSFNFDLLRRIPSVGGGLRLSVLNYLIKEDGSPFIKFLIRFVTVPQELRIPSSFHGALTTTVLTTFDDHIIHFPGTCSYIAARDVVNGNFTIIALYENGKLSGVTLSDKNGAVTYKQDKTLFNNVETDLPINKGGLNAFRTNSYVDMRSSSGVHILCALDFVGCGIEISGYYHGQIRGLLGNANNEKFDEQLLPNGKIVTSQAELAAVYAVESDSKCGQISSKIQPKPDETCEKLFSWGSGFRLCYPFVNPDKFKKICEYFVADGYPEPYKYISSYYNYRCFKWSIPLMMPSEHSYTCKNSEVHHNVEDRFTVKTPGKTADVLLLVDASKDSEALYKEYTQPLVVELVNEFKANGITDVVYHMMVFDGENPEPSIVTVKGKPTFKAPAPVVKFGEDQKPQKLVTGIPDIDRTIAFLRKVLNGVKITLGLDQTEQMWETALKYPFRAEATRTIIVSTNEPCELDSSEPYRVLYSILSNRKELNINAISPARHLKVKDAKKSKDIIGLTPSGVITVSEGKAKPEGNPALQKEITYNDFCIDCILGYQGNYFFSDNLMANKNSKQDIVQIMAKNIVKQALNREIELDCTCHLTYRTPFTPYNRCRSVDVKEKN